MPQAPGPTGAPSDVGPDGGVLPPDAIGPDGLPVGGGEMLPGEDEGAEDGEAPPFGDEDEDSSEPPGAADDGQDDDGPPPPKGKGDSKKPPPKKAAKVRRCKSSVADGLLCGAIVTQDDDGRWRHEDAELDRQHEAQPWWSPGTPREARRTYFGLDGRTVMTEDAYVRHLAASLSGHHPAVLEALRAESAREWPGDPAERARAIRQHIDGLVPVHWPGEDEHGPPEPEHDDDYWHERDR